MPRKPLRKVRLHRHFQVSANCVNRIAESIFFCLRLHFRAADQTTAGLMAEFLFPGSIFSIAGSHDILKKKHIGMDPVLKTHRNGSSLKIVACRKTL